MRANRIVPILIVGVLGASTAVAAGLTLAGATGAMIAVGAVLCSAIGVCWWDVRRRFMRQYRQTRRLAESVESLDQLTRSTRSSVIEVEERISLHVAAMSGLEARIDRAMESMRERTEESTGALIRTLERNLSDKAERTAAEVESVRSEMVAELAKLRTSTRDVIRQESRRQFGKMDDLLALYRDIAPDRALPPMHGWAAGADLIRFLYTLVTEQGRTRVLECGSGTTTVVLSYAMRKIGSGNVVSLEHDPEFAVATRRMLHERGLDDWAAVVDAPLVDIELPDGEWRWYDPASLPAGEFDLVLVDGPPGATGPQARYPALPVLLDKLAPDGVVVLDDAFRTDERATAERWLSEYNEFTSERIGHERGTIVLRRVGEKPR